MVHLFGRRVRPYVSTAAMAATAGIGEHPLVLLDHAIALVRIAVVVAIWRSVLGSGDLAEHLTVGGVLTYVVLARVFADQLSVRSEVLTAIWEGSVASRLLRPMSPFGDYLAEMAGGWVLRWVTFSVPALAVALALGVSIRPASAAHAAAFVVSLGLSIAVGSAFDFMFALLVVRGAENMWSFRTAREALIPLLSGAAIPLPLLPWSIGEVLAWMPFASMVSAPLLIYTAGGEVGRLLVLQAAWAAVLWPVTRYLWRRTAPRMVSFGG